ncbi:MAG: hypothetical protein ACO1TE_19920 [Prosthecobacter sp.]
MSASLSRLSRAICIAAAGMLAASSPSLAGPASSESAAIAGTDQTAADFLESVGKHTRARWRLLFRPPPPTPPTDRGRSALILGTLLGDSFLIWQAGDAQQFRNNNQDVLAYCRTLGLGEKLLPRLMTQGNLAEQSGWKDLRQEIVDGHQEAMRLLREQMDEDLALLIDVGVGLRLLEIVSSLITAAPEVNTMLFVGSPELLRELREDFSRISAAKREEPFMQRVRTVIDDSSALWHDVDKTPLTPEQLSKTNDTLKTLMQGMVER